MVTHVMFLFFFVIMNCVILSVFWFDGGYSLSSDLSVIGETLDVVSYDLDYVWCFFSLLLLFTTMLVVYFCFYYYGETSKEGYSLCGLLLVFSGVVWMMTASSNLVISLIWWDYLGIVSFFLVLRNCNKDSVYSSLVVILSSRIGDVGFFCLIGLLWCNGFNSGFSGVLVDVVMVLVVFSKTAVYPFSPWLIEAMRAPTAVSSLVHSATLVTAGVWFIFRYGGLVNVSESSSWIVIGMLLLTIYFSAAMACYSIDVKKLVAFSTCNNMAWCLLFSLLGFYGVALVQLFVHGVLKCVCFVFMGCRMCSNSSVQQWNSFYRFPVWANEFVSFFLLMIGLGGFPCYGLYWMKHVVLGVMVQSGGLVLSGMIILGSLMTALYVSRVVGMVLSLGDLGCVFGFQYVFGYWLIFVVVGAGFEWLGSLICSYGEAGVSFSLSGWDVVVSFIQVLVGLVFSSMVVFRGSYCGNLVRSVAGVNYVYSLLRSFGSIWGEISGWFVMLLECLLMLLYSGLKDGFSNLDVRWWLVSVVFFTGAVTWMLVFMS